MKLPAFTNNRLALLLLLGIIFLSVVTWRNAQSSCDTVVFINASASVERGTSRRLVGLNADTDMLRFGVLSPGTEARRSFVVQTKNSAQVRVWNEGSLKSWLFLEPAEFSLNASEPAEVTALLRIPLGASGGEYSGKVMVCLQEN